MEWVDGLSITEWARTRGNSSGDRRRLLETFLELCDAVQHAHANGVLHCDLKPSNVLVDTAGHPRVLDFGLAHLYRPGEVPQSRSEGLGTPAYAAPEQLRPGAPRPDARADVFSLGAILFELLTAQRLRSGSDWEIVAQAAEVAAPPKRLPRNATLDGELEAIVERSIAPEPERRYQSAGELAADLRRYLEGEPVHARSASALYLLRKWIARHRGVSVLLLLLLGASATYAGAAVLQARRLVEQRNRAEDARTAAERSEQEARRRSEQTRAMLEFLLRDVLMPADPRKSGQHPSLTEVLVNAARAMRNRFGAAPEIEAELSIWFSEALLSRDRHSEAVEALRAALSHLPATADPLLLGSLERRLASILGSVGKHQEAEEAYLAALGHLEADVESGAERNAALLDWGGLLIGDGRFDEARPLLDTARALEIEETAPRLARLEGLMLTGLGQLDEARVLTEKALAVEIARNGENPDGAAELMDLLADILTKQGELTPSIKLRRTVVATRQTRYGREHTETLAAVIRLAHLLAHVGQAEEAERLALECLEFERAGPTPCYAYEHLAVLGVARLNSGRFDEAEAACREALSEVTRCLGSDSPNRLAVLEWLAEALLEQGEFEESERLLEEVLAAHQRLPSEDAGLGSLFVLQGRFHGAAGDDDASANSFARAVAWFGERGWNRDLAKALERLAEVERRMGRSELANAHLAQAAALLAAFEPLPAARDNSR
jgi:tetratricopeptide (TPR) repeat protein